MAISDALAWRLNNGGSAEDLYATIRDFLAASPDAAATQTAMRQYGISGEDVANATGGASGGLLSGNILAGASWNSSNTALQNQLTEATGEQTSNYAVAGSTTTDTLNQLNTFLAGGGQFDPNATVYLQAGGVDFIQGVDKSVVKDNLNQIVKTLADQGVNVVLTGSPYAKSVEDVISNNFDPKVDQIYTDVAKANSNVALVGTQGEILQNKRLLVDALHTNAEGTAVYNQSVIDALSQFKNTVPDSTPEAIAQVQTSNVVATAPAQITQIAQTGKSMATNSTEATQGQNNASIPNTYTSENVNKLASQILSQGTTQAWTGGLPPETAARYMADDLARSGVTDISQVGKGQDGIINKVTGEKLVSGYGERTGGNLWSGSYEGKGNTGFGVNFDESGKPVFYTQGASSSTLKNDVLKLAAVAGAVYGLGGFEGLFGGAASGAGATGLTLAELGGTAGAGALTAAETAALYGTGASTLGTAGVIGSDLAGLSGIPAGTGALTAAEAASLYGTGSALGGAGVIGSDLAGLSGIPAGTGALTAAESAALYGTGGLTTGALTAGGAGATGLMGTGTGLTVAGTGGLGGASGVASLGGATGAGLTLGTAGLGALGTGAGLGTSALTTGGLLGANTLLGGAGLGTTLAGLGAGVGGSLLGTAATGLGAGNLANLLSGGLGTAGSLLQMQQSKEAALAAQQRIDAETAAAKASAAFRPIGMTTRFGTSQFAVDPVTGQLTSAGYTLSPEAKNAQDRLVKLAESGLVQAEGAQAQFAPLQTGAQSLFGLGNQYLAQNPQEVAQNYLNQQMALLQPGRDLELANIETRLRNQGRLGLSVAQGGNLGAASPELQALYNARARQEAELAANAQQLGQRDVLFGSSLLGQGAQTMGNYYGGQQQAYAPYTTALGQVQGLETAAQQPFTMGTNLAQQASTAGARAGELGLGGARLSTALATSANATANPYAQALMAAGNPNAMFGQALGNVFGGLFS